MARREPHLASALAGLRAPLALDRVSLERLTYDRVSLERLTYDRVSLERLTYLSALAGLRVPLALRSETPSLDAQVLIAHLTGRPRSWVLAHPEAALTPLQHERFQQALARAEQGIPLPYILGEWEFYGLPFTVTPAVLIPRPETELLVETALAWLATRGEGPRERPTALDVGTGSGCIAATLAARAPGLHVHATDLSPAALAIARRNARRHGVEPRLTFHHADLLPAGLPPVDLLCANLPYIPSAALRQLPIFGQEPTLALDGGPGGLDLIERLLAAAPSILKPGGFAALEIEASQGGEVAALAVRAFPEAHIRVLPDLSGKDRLLTIQTPPPPA